MLTKQNVSMKDETVIGLRATKAAVQDYGGVQNVQNHLTWSRLSKSPMTYILSIWTAGSKEKHKGRRKGKTEAQKRKFEEKKAEETALDEKCQKLKMEERQAHDLMKKAVSYIDEGGKKIHDGLKAGNMMEVEALNKLIEFGRQKQSEA